MLGVVGRNGMGKTTLCNAITGLVPARGSVQLAGEEILGLPPQRDHASAASATCRRAGACGRRCRSTSTCGWRRATQGAWTSSASTRRSRAWPSASATAARELSGGEQQMLAIGRALLLNPRLLVMDEPTEGLAPVIVEQVAADAAARSPPSGEIAVLLIEQNLGVAIDVADRIGVMVNGRIAHEMPARRTRRRPRTAAAAARRARGGDEDDRSSRDGAAGRRRRATQVLHGAPRPCDDGAPALDDRARRDRARLHALERRRQPRRPRRTTRACRAVDAQHGRRRDVDAARNGRAHARRCSNSRSPPAAGRAAYVAGTFDTKGRELFYLRQCLEQLGLRVVTVDLVDLGQAVAGERASARGRAPPSAGRSARCSPATAAARSAAMARRVRALPRAAGATSAA